MKKKLSVFLLCAISALTVSGCGGKDHYAKVYETAREKVLSSEQNASFLSEKIQKAKELSGRSDDQADGLLGGILFLEEISGKISDLFGSDSSKESSSPGRETSFEGNSFDRSPYDRAYAEKHGSGDLTEAELVRVVDGDTIVTCLDGSYSYVRLIGINTPESVAPNEYLEKTGKENTQEGKDASAHSKELLAEVKTVWLEFDEQEYDPYERILAYVWLSSDRADISYMLNAKILTDGYAEPMPVSPNLRYAESLAALVDDGK